MRRLSAFIYSPGVTLHFFSLFVLSYLIFAFARFALLLKKVFCHVCERKFERMFFNIFCRTKKKIQTQQWRREKLCNFSLFATFALLTSGVKIMRVTSWRMIWSSLVFFSCGLKLLVWLKVIMLVSICCSRIYFTGSGV